MADIARFDRALAVIEAHPELHHQGSWLVKLSCGTGGCLAGHVLLQEYPDGKPSLFSPGLRGVGGYGRTTFDGYRLADGTVVDVEEHAGKLLGLNYSQRSFVFDSGNSAKTLRAMRDTLAADPRATGTALYNIMPIDDEYLPDEDDDESGNA